MAEYDRASQILAELATYLSNISSRIDALEEHAAKKADKSVVADLPPDNARDPVRAVAATIWGEARGESSEGMLAVGCVIRNRVLNPGWWGEDWSSVCTAAKQFSCWWDRQGERVRCVDETDARFVKCLEIAKKIISGEAKDVTDGADHYHTGAVSPSWSKGVNPIKVIGSHRFFKLGRGAGSYRQ